MAFLALVCTTVAAGQAANSWVDPLDQVPGTATVSGADMPENRAHVPQEHVPPEQMRYQEQHELSFTATPGNGTVELRWKQAYLAEWNPNYYFEAATSYKILMRDVQSGQGFTAIETLPADARKYTVKNLTNGVTYEFRVEARGDTFVGFAYDLVRATPIGLPGQPQNLDATWHSETVILRWDDADDSGIPITEYSIVYRIGKVNPFSPLDTVPPTDGSFRHTYRAEGLTNGTPYEFAVFAKNRYGTGPPATITATPAGPPEAPPNFAATKSKNGIVLTWDTPDDRGSPIRYYSIVAFIDGSRSQTWIDSVPGTQTSYTVTDLSYEDKVEFRIDATNSHSRGPYSTATLTVSS